MKLEHWISYQNLVARLSKYNISEISFSFLRRNSLMQIIDNCPSLVFKCEEIWFQITWNETSFILDLGSQLKDLLLTTFFAKCNFDGTEEYHSVSFRATRLSKYALHEEDLALKFATHQSLILNILNTVRDIFNTPALAGAHTKQVPY